MASGVFVVCCPCLAPCLLVNSCASFVCACGKGCYKLSQKLGISFGVDPESAAVEVDYNQGMYPFMVIGFLIVSALCFLIGSFVCFAGGEIWQLIVGVVLLIYSLAWIAYIVIWFVSPFREEHGGCAYNRIIYYDSFMVFGLGPGGLITSSRGCWTPRHGQRRLLIMMFVRCRSGRQSESRRKDAQKKLKSSVSLRIRPLVSWRRRPAAARPSARSAVAAVALTMTPITPPPKARVKASSPRLTTGKELTSTDDVQVNPNPLEVTEASGDTTIHIDIKDTV